MVSEKKECDGSETRKGKFPSVDDCASQCKEEATMFIFGTNDYGNNRCNDDGCECRCETSATEEGTCNSINHNGYRLYKYGITNSKGYFHVLHKQDLLRDLTFSIICIDINQVL